MRSLENSMKRNVDCAIEVNTGLHVGFLQSGQANFPGSVCKVEMYRDQEL